MKKIDDIKFILVLIQNILTNFIIPIIFLVRFFYKLVSKQM